MIRQGFLSRFAAENASGPSVHITPGELFTVGGVPITNSILYGWISSVVIVVFLIYIARKMTLRPQGGLVQFVEILVDFITNLIESSLGSREKAQKYSPYFTTIFVYILLTNWLGLLPGVGDAFTIGGNPLFRPLTADLNGTLAAAVVIMFFVQWFAIRESGLANHLKHYFSAGSPWSPLTWFIGLFEMFGELTRVASLALRLFLNVAIGETIIAVFSYLGSVVAPVTALPFVILELLVGALQAYIFVMLSIMYLSVAVQHSHHDEDHHEDAAPKLTPIHEAK